MGGTAGDRHLDGNAVGGLLGEVFGVEATTALIVCAGCGSGGPVGAAAAYVSGIGAVVRCAGCGAALIRVVTVRGWACVDTAGAARLDLDGAPDV